MPGYLLDHQPDDRLDSLAEALDEGTVTRVMRIRDEWRCPPLTGGRCLEVGAGHSRVPYWLAALVGTGGEVVATDITARPVALARNMVYLAPHDITEEVPAGPFDLIHARLVLAHLPERERVLADLAGQLAPGGMLLVEEWDTTRPDTLVAAGSDEDAQAYRRVQYILTTGVFGANGVDGGWAQRVHPTMERHGLASVSTSIHGDVWLAGDAGCRQHAGTITQLWPRLLDLGVTADELDRVVALLLNPDSGLRVRSHLLWSTAGRRP